MKKRFCIRTMIEGRECFYQCDDCRASNLYIYIALSFAIGGLAAVVMSFTVGG